MFVELLAFCKLLVFRNSCYGRVAIVQDVCCAAYHSSTTVLLMCGKSSKARSENCKLAQLLEAVFFFSFCYCFGATRFLFCVQWCDDCKVKGNGLTVVVAAVNTLHSQVQIWLKKIFFNYNSPMQSITRKSNS